jgi:Cohesin domain
VRQRIKISLAIILLALSLVVAVPQSQTSSSQPQTNNSAPPSPTTPNVGVWNDLCFAANMTTANPQCALNGLTLAPGSKVTVDINVTNAPAFNGYELSLFFDQKFLSLYSVNFGPTGTMFDSPFIVANDNLTWGTIRAAEVNEASGSGNGTLFGSGILVSFTFSIKGLGATPFVLAAGTSKPAEGGGATEGDWTRLVYVNNKFIDVSTSNGYIQNDPPKLGPVAKFTYIPTSPLAGDTIDFNATSSFDPDNSASRITRYFWDFGNGVERQSASPVQYYSYRPPSGRPIFGNFSVLLIVLDSDNNFTGIITTLVGVGRPPLHDIGISLGLDHNAVKPGDNITVTAMVTNLGTFNENFNLSITYGPPTITLRNYSNQTVSPLYLQNSQTFKNQLSTKGFAIGTYEVDAVLVSYFPNNGTITAHATAKQTFTILVQQDSPLAYILVAAVGVVAALIVIRFVVKRRRVSEDE